MQKNEPISDIDRLLDQAGDRVVPVSDGDQLPVADWNCATEAVFNLPPVKSIPASAKPKRVISGYRLLTSDEIMDEKQKIKDEKERKEKGKEERRQKRLMKLSSKK